ncbi:hypothetical protein ACKUB1_13675 [Methanospirillum stamsii]|uniref:hypothetical protein n=1 Tax=Methanospirillum stamsii TaxID=1277351 RepID=UPI0015E850F7|nr:hypothetical protein [Methanospirillum stamsii]
MLTVQDHHDMQVMCHTFCFAGRKGKCASAGKDYLQTRDCLRMYRKSLQEGE